MENMIDFNKKYFSKFPFMPISGNHEGDSSYRGGSYEIYKHFNIKTSGSDNKKGIYYYFDYGNTRLIMLDTNNLSNKKLKSDQLSWLDSVLSTNSKKWTIVSMHNPMYSPGKWGSNPSNNSVALALREQLSGIFAKYKVDLVLQGHDHLFSRTHPIDKDGNPLSSSATQVIDSVSHYVNPNGTIYAMHSVAGNQIRNYYSSYDRSLYSFVSNTKTNSWAEISVDSDTLTVKVYSAADGNTTLIDSYGITK